MKRVPVLFAVLLVPALLHPLAARAGSDPRAVEVAERLMDAMGGKAAFEAQRLVVFSFAAYRDGEEAMNRRHAWDRDTGRYRIGTTLNDGRELEIVFDVEDGGGEVWLDGAAATGEEKTTWLERAPRIFINDTYWLLMPWKWLDPGVHLAYEGERDLEGVPHDVVRLSFDEGVGVTSNDVYWGFVSRETGLLSRWEYVLQDREGNPGTGDPTVWVWTDWKDAGGGVLIATVKRNGADASRSLRHPLVWMSPRVDPRVLTRGEGFER